jgi:HAD superfamily hydrolase (TIGR01509 family)
MKTILIDAWNTFITGEGMFQEMYELLEQYPNPKLILTNANDEQLIELGIVDMPYEVFTLKHNPDKVDPIYYQTMLSKFNFDPSQLVYFEHNADAVASAAGVGITVFHYDKEARDLASLKNFLDQNLN